MDELKIIGKPVPRHDAFEKAMAISTAAPAAGEAATNTATTPAAAIA